MPEVTRSLEVPASPDRAWRVISTREGLTGWLGGAVEIDVRPGGGGSVELPEGPRELAVEEVVEGRRLVLHWWPAGARGRTPAERGACTVELEVEECEEGSRILVTEHAPLGSSTSGGSSAAPQARALACV